MITQKYLLLANEYCGVNSVFNTHTKTNMITDQKLYAYSQDTLPEAEAKLLELALRDSEELRLRLHGLLKQALTGEHSISEIWRSQQLSCPTRNDWGRFILKLGSEAELDYFHFHLNVVHCEICQSNLADLQELYQLQELHHLQKPYQQEQKAEFNKSMIHAEQESRRQRFFNSSRGFLAEND
jgi:hypothetical protein